MQKIRLTKGKFTIVSDIDFKWLNEYKWYCNDKNYAVRTLYLGGGRKNPVSKHISMSRLIMGNPTGFEIDHINGDTLNNSRENLRIVTHSQNAKNRKGDHSKGVTPNTSRGMKNLIWRARIRVNGKEIFLGCFIKKEDAILAYKQAVKKYFGKFARKMACT